MSVVVVQVGQCGNQLGACFLKQAFEECSGSDSMHVFFVERESGGRLVAAGLGPNGGATASRDPEQQRNWIARSCMIDTEPKAVEYASQVSRISGGRWAYNTTQCQAVGQRGAGNNWAHGYYEHGHHLSESICKAIGSAVEACDRLAGFVVLMSLAGGTGSGVGTFTCELLRDIYPHVPVLCVPVAPYSAGEVIVQSYNASLSLSRLLKSCDGVAAVSNDSLDKICRLRLALDKVSLQDLNGVLANQLTGLLLPTGGRPVCRLADICTHTASHPDYRLLQLYSVPQLAASRHPFSSYTWAGLTRLLAQMVRTGQSSEDGLDWSTTTAAAADSHGDKRQHVCTASLLVARGRGDDGGAGGAQELETAALRTSMSFCKWTPEPFLVWHGERPCRSSDKSCTMLVNSSACVRPLQLLVQRAWRMYTARAYTHQYTEHGCTDADFLHTFSHMEQTIANYERL